MIRQFFLGIFLVENSLVQSSMDERVSPEPWMYLLAAAVLMEEIGRAHV